MTNRCSGGTAVTASEQARRACPRAQMRTASLSNKRPGAPPSPEHRHSSTLLHFAAVSSYFIACMCTRRLGCCTRLLSLDCLNHATSASFALGPALLRGTCQGSPEPASPNVGCRCGRARLYRMPTCPTFGSSSASPPVHSPCLRRRLPAPLITATRTAAVTASSRIESRAALPLKPLLLSVGNVIIRQDPHIEPVCSRTFTRPPCYIVHVECSLCPRSVRSSDPLPTAYYLFFAGVEPLLTFAGAGRAYLDAEQYFVELYPPRMTAAPKRTGLHPAAPMAVRQLGSCFFLFALLACVLLPTLRRTLASQPAELERIIKAYLGCLAAADLTVSSASETPLPASERKRSGP